MDLVARVKGLLLGVFAVVILMVIALNGLNGNFATVITRVATCLTTPASV